MNTVHTSVGLIGLVMMSVAGSAGAVTYTPLGDMGNDVGVHGGLFDLSVGAAAATPQTANGSFVTYVHGALELGLRASLRYDDSATPGLAQPVTNFDGNHSYTFDSTQGNAPAGMAVWNFDWWINTAYTDPTLTQPPPNLHLGLLSDNYFLLTITDPFGHTATRSPFVYPFGLTLPFGATQQISASAAYGSENVGSADYGPVWGDVNGTFKVDLTIFAKDCVTFTFPTTVTTCTRGDALQTVSINVTAVPVPASLPLLAGGFGLMALMRRRRSQSAA